MSKTRPALALAAACLFAVSACSTTKPEASGGGSGGDVKTGNGGTDSDINVGVLTDLSGPFAVGAAVQVTEFKAYWDKVNTDGGICNRDVKLQVQDHGYDPQKAVSRTAACRRTSSRCSRSSAGRPVPPSCPWPSRTACTSEAWA